jgi:hypothetical protein
METTFPRRVAPPGGTDPGTLQEAPPAIHPAAAKAREAEEIHAPASAGTTPTAQAKAPGFKEMAAPAPAANERAASCIRLKSLKKGPESDRFLQY